MKKKNLLFPFILTALSLVLTFLASQSSLFSQFELKSLDFRFQLRGKKPADPVIRIVGIDDASLERFGRWPWSRSYHGELMNALSEFPPRTVGFDFLFGEEDLNNPEYDEALVHFSQLLGNVVFASYFELLGEESKEILTKEKENKKFDETLIQKMALTQVIGDPSQLWEAKEIHLPFPALAQAAKFGFINAPRDADGSIRRLPLIMQYKGKVYPSFVLQLLMDYWKCGQDDVTVVVGKGIDVLKREGAVFIPTDKQGNLLINFVGDHSDFNENLFVQVLNATSQIKAGEKPDIDLEQFWKKIVLVALTATGTTDMGAFPFSEHSPLIAIHANALDTILKQNFLRQIKPTHSWGILVGLAAALFLLTALLSPLKSAVAALVLLLGTVLCNYYLFLQGWWLPLVLPVILWLLMTLTITTFRYFTEEKEKRYLRKAFGQYVSPKILKELLDDPTKLKLGGERRELTVLFSDVRGFTPFCEKRQPEEVVEILNEYLDRMTEVIFKHNGTLDKYVGDAIVAFFGAPSTKIETDHALRACQAALEMIEELKKLQKKWTAEGKEALSIGIGLNSGSMLVGNMGSKRKFDYTVIGDHVNLGARLESQTRHYNCNIILSEYTLQHVQDGVQTHKLDEVTVKGKQKPVLIYELIGLSPSLTER